MRHVFTRLSGRQRLAGTVSNGSRSEAVDIEKYGKLPFQLVSNVDQRDSYNRYWSLAQPPVVVRQYSAIQPGTDRFFTNNLWYFGAYENRFWDGAQADIYLAANGVRTLLATATVTDSRMSAIAAPSGVGCMADDTMVTDTTYEHTLPSSSRDGALIGYRVAAINANGEIGPRSTWATFTTQGGSGSASNPTLTSITYSATPSALDAPTNVAVTAKVGFTGTAVITWDAVSGAAGYILDISWQDPTVNPATDYIDFDTTSLAIPQGAVVVLRKTLLTNTDKWGARLFNANDTDRVRGIPAFEARFASGATKAEFIAYDGDRPTGVDAGYFLRIPFITGESLIRTPVHSGITASNEFYPVLEANKDYKVRMLARTSAPVSLTSTVEQVTTGGSATFNLTTDFQWFEQTFSRDSVYQESQLGRWSVSGPSGTVLDVAVAEVLLSPTSDVDDLEERAAARTFPGLWLRDASHIAGASSGQTVRVRDLFNRHNALGLGHTFYARLRVCQIHECNPWLQLQWFHSPSEWADLVAYLAAPADSGHPMADLRVAQGQSAPWVELFPLTILEIGNEAWNGAGSWFETVNNPLYDTVLETTLGAGASYAAHVNACVTAMEQSPYWGRFRRRVKIYAGAQNSGSSFENSMLASSVARGFDGIGHAPYIAGWENNVLPTETGEFFRELLADDNDLATRQTRYGGFETAGKNVINYEGGPGYVTSGATAEQSLAQELIQKSRASGTANIAATSIRAAAGLEIEAHYKIKRDNVWSSHAAETSGGGTYMHHGILKMLLSTTGPAYVRKIATVDPPMRDTVELIQAFEYTSAADPSNRIFVAVNRDIDPSLLNVDDPLYSATPAGTHAVTVPTGLASATGLAYWANVGNFRDHNRFPVGFRRNLATRALDVVDPTCVAFTYDWTTGSVPGNPANLVINDTYGAVSGGLPAGNCVLIHMTGCVDA